MKLLSPLLVALGRARSLAACERAKAPPPGDSARASGPARRRLGHRGAAARSDWDPSAGPVLLVVGGDAGARVRRAARTARVPRPSWRNIPHPASVTLFGRGGTVQTAELPAVADTGACIVAALSAAPRRGRGTSDSSAASCRRSAMDSTESLSHADSAALVVADDAPRVGVAERFGGPVRRAAVRRARGLALHASERPASRRGQSVAPDQSGGDAAAGANACSIAERTPADTHVRDRPTPSARTATRRRSRAATCSPPRSSAPIATPALVIVRDYGDATAYGIARARRRRAVACAAGRARAGTVEPIATASSDAAERCGRAHAAGDARERGEREEYGSARNS